MNNSLKLNHIRGNGGRIRHPLYRGNAFTLAEVLITLGIIGIVAAMTIPTLVANYQRKNWDTSAKVFSLKLTEALKTMNTMGVLGANGGYTTTEGFVGELQKHLKINKVCQNDDLSLCFPDTIIMDEKAVDMSKMKTADNLGQMSWGTNVVGILVGSGVSALVAYNPKCTSNPFDNNITGDDCLAIIYDTSGFSSPNEILKDVNKNANAKKLLAIDYEFTPPVACQKFGGYMGCGNSQVQAEASDVVVTDFTGLDPTQISSDGTRMTFEMAAKVCSDRGLRLPNPSEANSIYNSLGSSSFQYDNYWVSVVSSANTCSTQSTVVTGNCTNCYLGGRNCGSKNASAFNRVRCVK